MTETLEVIRARQELRNARIRDVLSGDPPEGDRVRAARDRLLEVVMRATDMEAESADDFDSAELAVIDTAVSLALAEVSESETDSLLVILMCIQVLSIDGHFARLSLLGRKIEDLGQSFNNTRPYLALACRAFGLVLRGMERNAHGQLTTALMEGTGSSRRSTEQILDVLVCASLRDIIRGSNRLLEKSRKLALESSEGFPYQFLESIGSWRNSAEKARPGKVLAEADETYRDGRLQSYLASKHPVLFPAQIAAIHAGVTRDIDRVVSLPTSSGKTLIAELRVAATLHRNPDSRVIYVAPYRLLARQVQRSFSRGLSSLGFTVQDLGSGFDPDIRESEISRDDLPNVAICTPERLDSLLRISGQPTSAGAKAKELFDSCALLIFDELQLVGRPGRGPRFELILARIRQRYPNWKMLGLCAASQGTDELSAWLTAQNSISGARRPTGTLEIVWKTNGDLIQRFPGHRPVTVTRIDRGSKPADDAASLILRLDAKYRPVLAVETTRSQAESLAKKVHGQSLDVGSSWREQLPEHRREQVDIAVEEIENLLGPDHPLADLVRHGVAFHHAGLPTPILRQVERLSANRAIRIVCATTTVAEGADLPFRAVVIPHLNFSSTSGRLDRDLYLNIIGRAGRANVAVEGMVFILDSDARTLRNLVEGNLWADATRDRVTGRLYEIADRAGSTNDLRTWQGYLEIQSQVMAWLGEGNSYVDEQSTSLAALTLSWSSGHEPQKRRISELIEASIRDLDERGLAVAGSPYQLTPFGGRARLTGLSAPTVSRLGNKVAEASEDWLPDLVLTSEISLDQAEKISRLLFQSFEMLEGGLWLRRMGQDNKLDTMKSLSSNSLSWPDRDPVFESDVSLLASWIRGKSYAVISREAPMANNKRSLFGSGEAAARISDAAEYLGKLTYPAAWVWSAVKVLAGALGESLPSFVRDGIELGVPSEGAVRLINSVGLSRPGALMVASHSGPSWSQVVDWVRFGEDGVFQDLELTRLDLQRLTAFRASL
ncbi:DEAD/DEAH box helicase [Streptomyces sp. NPDC000971]|uniref:DEAD/DEAH box helicase n=1 Tax=Streptomyces sp. NPDC000971 TaxID=3156647 RepID=UPI0033224FAA